MPGEGRAASPAAFILGLGAQKAGTTWLHQYLSSRGDVLMSPIKEMHFFCPPPPDVPHSRLQRLLDEIGLPRGRARAQAMAERLRIKSDEAYFEYFLRRLGPAHRAFGEITPSYGEMPMEVLERIRAAYPKVRPVLLLRDPVDRLFSAMRMHAAAPGAIDTGDVEAAWDNPVHRARSDYELAIRNATAVFGGGGVLIEFFERLFTSTAVARLCAFLDLPFKNGDYGRPVHTTRPSDATAAAVERARQLLGPTYDFCRRWFSADLPAQWR